MDRSIEVRRPEGCQAVIYTSETVESRGSFLETIPPRERIDMALYCGSRSQPISESYHYSKWIGNRHNKRDEAVERAKGLATSALSGMCIGCPNRISQEATTPASE